MSTDHIFWRERRAEADSNRGPSSYQPNALPLGQTGSQVSVDVKRHVYLYLLYGHLTRASGGRQPWSATEAQYTVVSLVGKSPSRRKTLKQNPDSKTTLRQSQGKQLQTEVLVGGADSFRGQWEPYPFNKNKNSSGNVRGDRY